MMDQSHLIVSLVGGEPQSEWFADLSTERAGLLSFSRAVLHGDHYPIPNGEVLDGIQAMEAIVRSVAAWPLGRAIREPGSPPDWPMD